MSQAEEQPAAQAPADSPQQQDCAAQQTQPAQRHGLMGGGLMGGYGSSGFAHAMGMGMSIGGGLMQSILR